MYILIAVILYFIYIYDLRYLFYDAMSYDATYNL